MSCCQGLNLVGCGGGLALWFRALGEGEVWANSVAAAGNEMRFSSHQTPSEKALMIHTPGGREIALEIYEGSASARPVVLSRLAALWLHSGEICRYFDPERQRFRLESTSTSRG
jgi:hypothetical protein